MRQKNHMAEEIINKLGQAETELAQGATVYIQRSPLW